MRLARLLLLPLLFVLSAQTAIAHQTVLLISCDGFRWDYPLWYDTPFLDSIARNGVSGNLVPSFPSKTFPNHYTLATGLRPEHHGIIANQFLDRQTGAHFSLSDSVTKFDAHYYKGEPLWLTAQRQGLHTAVFYWPGSDVPVQGTYPDVWFAYNQTPRLTPSQRVDSILGQLTSPHRPELIMAYFEEPDHSGHYFGPQGKETRHAVEAIDSLLASLWMRIGTTGLRDSINLLVVSDHGMTWFTPHGQIHVDKYLHSDWYQCIEGNLPANIYASETWQQDSIVHALSNVPHLRVWRKADIPAWLHYQADPNIGDIVAVPDQGFIFTDLPCTYGGVHGYDPAHNDMHALFRACGPNLQRGTALGQFSNTAVYPLACHLLGIQPAPNNGEEAFHAIQEKTLISFKETTEKATSPKKSNLKRRKNNGKRIIKP